MQISQHRTLSSRKDVYIPPHHVLVGWTRNRIRRRLHPKLYNKSFRIFFPSRIVYQEPRWAMPRGKSCVSFHILYIYTALTLMQDERGAYTRIAWPRQAMFHSSLNHSSKWCEENNNTTVLSRRQQNEQLVHTRYEAAQWNVFIESNMWHDFTTTFELFSPSHAFNDKFAGIEQQQQKNEL